MVEPARRSPQHRGCRTILSEEVASLVGNEPLLVTLVTLVERLPPPPPPAARGRGSPRFYPDRLFLKALVIMIVRHRHTVHALLAVLAQPPAEMRALRAALTHDGRFPCRRTWERRLDALPAALPAQIGCLGRQLVALVQPWRTSGRAVAVDRTTRQARGGVWHTVHRARGDVPHTSSDTEAHWTTSGWHGWVDGWTRPRVSTVAAVWIPLAAALTPANADAAATALPLLDALPAAVRFLLGDRHSNTPDLRQRCQADGRVLVAAHHGRYPHADEGGEVRRVFHTLRSLAMENFNEHVTGSFDGHGPVCTRGDRNTRRFALGAVVVYQLALLYRVEHDFPRNIGLKAFLKAA